MNISFKLVFTTGIKKSFEFRYLLKKLGLKRRLVYHTYGVVITNAFVCTSIASKNRQTTGFRYEIKDQYFSLMRLHDECMLWSSESRVPAKKSLVK